jgi:hypothetical protein
VDDRVRITPGGIRSGGSRRSTSSTRATLRLMRRLPESHHCCPSAVGATARGMLREIAMLPAVVALLKSAPRDTAYQQSLEPIQVRNAIKASVHWVIDENGESFRVLSLMH